MSHEEKEPLRHKGTKERQEKKRRDNTGCDEMQR
jgi:hypothetical protein